MDERVVKFRVGVMVLSTVIIAAILVLLFGDMKSVVTGSYTLYIRFPQAPGVTEGTPVRKSGILIGRVTDVQLDDAGGAIVTVKINANVRLRRTEVARITSSLLGDAIIQFVPGDTTPGISPRNGAPALPGKNRQTSGDRGFAYLLCDAELPAAGHIPARPPAQAQDASQFIQPGEYIEGQVQTNPLQVISDLQGDMGQAISAVSTAGNEVGLLARHLNDLLASNDEQLNRIVRKTEQSLDTFQRALSNIDSVMGDAKVRDDLKRSIEQMPQLLKSTRSTMTGMQSAIEAIDRNMRNLEGVTKPLGERGEGMVTRIDQTIGRLDEVLTQMGEFSRSLNQQKGSLGQLLQNPELYQRLNQAACNIEQITRDLKPIVKDARAFSDKIARHPETLGVRGALRPSSGIK